MANFLQDTLEEIALERKNKEVDKTNESKAYEFAQFLKKVFIFFLFKQTIKCV